MAEKTTRRRFLQGSTAVGALALAGCAGDDPEENEPEGTDEEGTQAAYEVWALDQGTQYLHVLAPDDEGGVETTESVDLAAQDDRIQTPHMIDFDETGEYAVIANTAGGTTAIVRVEDRQVVDVLETGAVSHYAGVAPDNETIHVDAIGAETIVELDADFENEEFGIARELDLSEDETFQAEDYTTNSPVCHEYARDGEIAYVTLGPGFDDAGLFALDTEAMEVVETYDPEEVRANCGTTPHPEKDEFVVNGGGGPDDPSPWYVIDTETHEIVEEGDTDGANAHGLWFTRDNQELWQINRVTNDGVIYNADTYEQVDTLEEIGPAGVGDLDEVPYEPDSETYENPGDKPDIIAASPDDEFMFITMRGQQPQSAAPFSVGENPGVAVLDVETRERVDLLQPADDIESSDFHGINVVER